MDIETLILGVEVMNYSKDSLQLCVSTRERIFFVHFFSFESLHFSINSLHARMHNTPHTQQPFSFHTLSIRLLFFFLFFVQDYTLIYKFLRRKTVYLFNLFKKERFSLFPYPFNN
jgi:hypothetical protein